MNVCGAHVLMCVHALWQSLVFYVSFFMPNLGPLAFLWQQVCKRGGWLYMQPVKERSPKPSAMQEHFEVKGKPGPRNGKPIRLSFTQKG